MISMLHSLFQLPSITLLFWQDFIEIFCFIYFFYRFPVWLLQHDRKQRIGYFYSYAALILGAYGMHLALLFWITLLSAPIFLMALILCPIAQARIQPVKIVPRQPTMPNSYYTDIVQCSLCIMHAQKNIHWIISDASYHEFYTAIEGIPFNAELSFDTLRLLTTHETYNNQCAVWIDTRGIILKYNIPLPLVVEIPRMIHVSNHDTTLFSLRSADQEHIVCTAHEAIQFLKKYFATVQVQGKNNAPHHSRTDISQHSL